MAVHAAGFLLGRINGRLPEIPRRPAQIVVLAPPSRMEARGLTADMVKKGATVRVVAYPHKEVKDEMRAERIFVGDKKFELR